MRLFRITNAGSALPGLPTAGIAPAHPPATPLPALTSLRFFAAFYVLVFHYAGFYFPDAAVPAAIRLGHTGVSFFFVLSGFILAYTYHRVDLADAGRRSRFVLARVARIYPAFLLSLAINLPWFAAWVAKTAPPLKGFMASGAVLAPLALHAWVPGAACSLNCASWSISVEAFFYLLFPLLLPLVLRRPGTSAVAALGLWVAFAALATLLWHQVAPGVSLIGPEPGGTVPILFAQLIKYDPLLRLPEFIAGLVLFVLWQRLRLSAASLPAAWLAVITGAAAVLLVLGEPVVPEPVMHNGLTVLVWAPLVLLGAGLHRGPLAGAPLVFLGRISFALYLLHMPMYSIVGSLDRAAFHGTLAQSPWIAAGVATACSLLGAALVHLCVEEPARRLLLRGNLLVRLRAAIARLPRRAALPSGTPER